MTENIKHKSVAGWLIFLFFALLVPMLVSWQAFVFCESVSAEASLRRYQIEAAATLELLRVSADAHFYICTCMNDVFLKTKNPKQLQKALLEFRQSSGLAFDYLIWDKNGMVFSSDFDWQSIDADWQQAWQTLFAIARRRREVADLSETANLRKIFGPQFFPEIHSQCYSGRNMRLLLSDSSLKKKLAWIKTGSKMGLVAFFDHNAVEGLPGLEVLVRQRVKEKGLRLAAVKDGKWLGSEKPVLTAEELSTVCAGYDNPHRVRNWYVFKNTLHTGLYGICYIDADKIDRLFIGPAAKAAIVFFALVAVFIIWHSYLVFCCGKSLSISIRKQLVILFFLSNAISLLIMTLIGYDYLGQYRLFLQTESFSKGITYLQNIDEMFVSEFSQQLRRITKALKKLEQRVLSDPPNAEIIKEFLAQFPHKPFRLFLIGSDTPYIGSELGIMKDGKFVEEINMDWARYKSMQTLVDSMGKLGQYYLALLNRDSVSEIMATQIELIAESLGQLRPVEMFQEFFASTGSFWQWGMGFRYFPAYIDVFRHPVTGRANYVFLYLWKAELLQRQYIDRQLTDFNRNPLDLKVMAVDENFFYANPPELLKDAHLSRYSTKLRDRTGTEIEFCSWDGEKHLLMGLKCTSLDSIRLIGLYPVAKIDRLVQQKKQVFVALGFVSILVSLAMGLFVSRSILLPLAELQLGIQALQKRNFAFRLPDLGGDEFGDLARVFNTTLIDLEELHVASIVQEKISDSMSKPATVGNLTYFAASSGQGLASGDYLSISQLADQRLLILTGDVAGHGIGVSLITAFIRASLLQLVDLYDQPDKLLDRLDTLLRELSNHRQRKFMTMQCALFAPNTAELVLGNAGHCYPVVVDRNRRSAKVIDLPSLPLGAGKKNDYHTVALKLSAGESLILYTGGLYRNGEAGYTHFLNALVNCSSPCPKTWHDEVIAEVYGRVASKDCHDDMTLVVINCNPEVPVNGKENN